MRKIEAFMLALAVIAPASPAVAQVVEAESVAPRVGASVQSGARQMALDPARSEFWQALGDPTLTQLLQQAMLGSYELESAAARVEGADAARWQAAFELAPKVSAAAGYARRRLASATFPGVGVLPDQDLWSSGLVLDWEVDLFGRLRGGLDARNHIVRSTNEDHRDAQVSVVTGLARSYFDLRGAEEQLAVARRNAENQQRTLELTRKRHDAGRGTAFDTERALAQLSLTLAAIPLLEARISAAHHRIAVLVGRPPREMGVQLAGTGRLPELPDVAPPLSPSDLIRTRPDVLGAEQRLDATRSLVSAARADYLPRLTLSAGAGYTAGQVDQFGDQGTFNYTFGPVLSWAAFDLGRVKARTDEAHALELEARASYEQTLLVAEEQLESATARYQAARARLEHLRSAAAASERAATLAVVRYEGGIADFLQVLDAERTVLAAQNLLAEGQTQAADAYVALFEARAGR